MDKGFLAILAISLIATAAGAQTPIIDPSNTYVAEPAGACLSNKYVRLDELVCYAEYSELLASPEKFYGREIYTYGFLSRERGELLLRPFNNAGAEGYDKIYVEPRIVSDSRKRVISSRVAQKLERGVWVDIVGTFAKVDSRRAPALGVLKDMHYIADPANEDSLSDYMPAVHLKKVSPVPSTPPQFQTAPEAH